MPKGSKTIYAEEYPFVLALLKEARSKAGLTQVELAKAAGLSQAYVSAVERGVLRQDSLQVRTWMQACGTTFSKYARELDKRLGEAGY
jgi:transcriptional regulator with XRE-family HTH domain